MTSAHTRDKFVWVFLHVHHNKEDLSQEKIDSLQQGHLNNILKLARNGKLLVAGPLEGGGSIFIMNTESVIQAKEWITTDPAVKANRYKVEILPWIPRLGTVCLAKEDAEMIPFTFVRYNTHITKFNVRDLPNLFRMHDEYLMKIVKTGNVISEGVFDNNDGGIMIMKGEVDPSVIMADPSVVNGIIEPEIKRIWVAQGSFCKSK